MRQSSSQTIRGSNDLAGLIDRVAAEIALSQAATAAVDEAAAKLLAVNSTDLRCLGRLHAGGPMTAGSLAAACGLSKGAMTTALDRLELAGYVKRVRSDADRRRVGIQVTPRASELMDAIWGPIAAAGKAQLGEYTAEQLELLIDFLRRSRELQEREAERIRKLPAPSRPKALPYSGPFGLKGAP